MNGQGQPFRAGAPAAVAVEYSCAGALPALPRFLISLLVELTNLAPSSPWVHHAAFHSTDCAASNEIKAREPIRCRECGCRVMYKKRIKRSASSLPRLPLGRTLRARTVANPLTSPLLALVRASRRSGASSSPAPSSSPSRAVASAGADPQSRAHRSSSRPDRRSSATPPPSAVTPCPPTATSPAPRLDSPTRLPDTL